MKYKGIETMKYICICFLSLSALGDTYVLKNKIGWETTGIDVSHGDMLKIICEDGVRNIPSTRTNNGIVAKTGNLIGKIGECIFDVGDGIFFQSSSCSGILKLRRNFSQSPNGNSTVYIYVKRNDDVKLDTQKIQSKNNEGDRQKYFKAIAEIVKEEHTRLIKTKESKISNMRSAIGRLEISVKNEYRKAHISGDKNLFYSLRNKRDSLKSSMYKEQQTVKSLQKNNNILLKKDLLAGIWLCAYDIKRHLSSSKTHKFFQYNYVTKLQSIDRSSVLGKGDDKTLIHLKRVKGANLIPDNDIILTVMIIDGVFQYENVLGIKKTIPSYDCLLAISKHNLSKYH